MKNYSRVLLSAVLGLSLVSARAQMGGMGGPGGGMGPQFNGPLLKLFGDNTAFSATVQMEAKVAAMGQNMTINMPGKVSFDSGKARVEIDITQIKGLPMPAGAAEQMKSMGMDKMVMISLPDKKVTCMIYPGLKAYAELPMEDSDATKPQSAFKMEKSELGKETVDGHACTKYKATVTDEKGEKHDFTVWTANDMKDFPVKIDFVEEGNSVLMQLKDVKLAKPAASLFVAPAEFKKYDNFMALIQEQMMKQMGPGGPGGTPPPPK